MKILVIRVENCRIDVGFAMQYFIQSQKLLSAYLWPVTDFFFFFVTILR